MTLPTSDDRTTRLVTHADIVLVGMAAIAAAPMDYALDYAGRGWK